MTTNLWFHPPGISPSCNYVSHVACQEWTHTPCKTRKKPFCPKRRRRVQQTCRECVECGGDDIEYIILHQLYVFELLFFLVPPLPSHCAYPHLRHCIVCEFCCICSSLCAPLLFHSGRWGFPIQFYNEECKAGTSRSRSRIHSKVLIAICLLNCSVCSLILYVSD